MKRGWHICSISAGKIERGKQIHPNSKLHKGLTLVSPFLRRVRESRLVPKKFSSVVSPWVILALGRGEKLRSSLMQWDLDFEKLSSNKIPEGNYDNQPCRNCNLQLVIRSMASKAHRRSITGINPRKSQSFFLAASVFHINFYEEILGKGRRRFATLLKWAEVTRSLAEGLL